MYFPYPLQSELACIVCLKNFYIPSKHTAPVELTGSGEPLSSIEKHFCGGSVLPLIFRNVQTLLFVVSLLSCWTESEPPWLEGVQVVIETPRQFSSGSPVAWVIGARAGSWSRSVTENTGCVWSPPAWSVRSSLLPPERSSRRKCYSSVCLPHSEHQAERGTPAQSWSRSPDWTGGGRTAWPDWPDYRLLLCYQTALLSHRGTLGLLESERPGHSPPCTQDWHKLLTSQLNTLSPLLFSNLHPMVGPVTEPAGVSLAWGREGLRFPGRNWILVKR